MSKRSDSGEEFLSKRQYIRFPAGALDNAQLDFMNLVPKDFQPEITALITEESSAGCGLVALNNDIIKQGMACLVKVGNLAPVKATVVWTKALDIKVLTFGVRYDR
jgi:hypothetical protein